MLQSASNEGGINKHPFWLPTAGNYWTNKCYCWKLSQHIEICCLHNSLSQIASQISTSIPGRKKMLTQFKLFVRWSIKLVVFNARLHCDILNDNQLLLNTDTKMVQIMNRIAVNINLMGMLLFLGTVLVSLINSCAKEFLWFLLLWEL